MVRTILRSNKTKGGNHRARLDGFGFVIDTDLTKAARWVADVSMLMFRLLGCNTLGH